jgi:hypothetical protein
MFYSLLSEQSIYFLRPQEQDILLGRGSHERPRTMYSKVNVCSGGIFISRSQSCGAASTLSDAITNASRLSRL